jgi:hypothetical protein
MKTQISLFFAIFMLVSCDSRQPASRESSTSPGGDYLRVEGELVLIPSFDIVLEVDQKARAKLKADKESIVILTYFSGLPTEAAEKKYPEYEMEGEILLAKSALEVQNGFTAKIENIKFPKARYDDLADKDISLLVNVVSARKSSTENYLDCGIIEGKMSAIAGKSFTIKCKLIEN